ncbi:MAG: flavodoxin family protein [Desulfitobacteriaceae bacterium]|nr:flavodoxin family protein [Desulfitobacteriaceae bacterium]
MKVLGVIGSFRKKGNASFLVQKALKPFKEADIETELIFLRDYDIKGCNGCEGCKETYKCTVKDDMQKLYPLILEAEAIILGSPTYFYNMSADMKAFIDRCYCFNVFDDEDRSVWTSLNEVLGVKYAGVIAVCEQDNEAGMGVTAEAMKRSLESLGYRVISTVKALNAYKAGEVLNNKKVMDEARRAGERLLKSIQLKERVKNQLSIKE